MSVRLFSRKAWRALVPERVHGFLVVLSQIGERFVREGRIEDRVGNLLQSDIDREFGPFIIT
jgi:hypothetical protein